MASSSLSPSSSSYQAKKYDIFISFRGDDVRNKFLSHLFNALKIRGINAFKDEKLKKGRNITPALLQVIKESHISIVIFSQNYAYSSWCLDELAQILNCVKTTNQRVIPVFYEVDPCHVQQLQGNFKDALLHHAKEYSSQKVNIWSRALQELSCFTGFVSSTERPEFEFVDEIADIVSKELSEMYSSDYKTDGLFGIDLHVRRVESLLCMNLRNHVRIVGVWGIGGIGKTTIADKLYNRIKNGFDAHCFLANVREALQKKAPHDVRDEIFRELLAEKDVFIGTPGSIEPSIKRRLQCKTTLLVLDDVDNSTQLRWLLGVPGLYSPGSRIIVTSRDCQVLKNIGAKECIYQVDGLNNYHALQLFSWHAFHQNHPQSGYMDLSKRVIAYAKGVPLMLIVLGSNLYDRSMKEWSDELGKLKNVPSKEVQKILQISYDGLERDEKKIFLDIACFFKGYKKDWVEGMLKSFGFFPECGIGRLRDKSLVGLDQFSNLTMHDLIEQMAREIVVEESNGMAGEQSRLWTSKDIIHVLKNNLGTAKIGGISLHLDEISGNVGINCKAFKHMHNLKFLQISFLNGTTTADLMPNGLEFLPSNLRYLKWDWYPLNYLPSDFCPEYLVELHMQYSQLKQLQNLHKSVKSLKRIDLSFSRDLIRITDLSKAPNLEVLELEGCSSLIEISWSVEARSRCTRLNLSGCVSLRRLLEIPSNIEELVLNGTPIEQIPTEFGCLDRLRELDLRGCWKLTSLPDTICNLHNLEVVDVSDCTSLRQLPKNLGNLRNLKFLYAAKSGIQELPDSITKLTGLIELNCSGCVGLKSPFLSRCTFPSVKRNPWPFVQKSVKSVFAQCKPEKIQVSIGLPGLEGLMNLYKVDLSNCHLSEYPRNMLFLRTVKELYLGGNDFNRIPGLSALMAPWSRLRLLNLRDCIRLEHLPQLPPSLEFLEATNCASLKSASNFVLPRSHLGLSNCIKLNQQTSAIIMDRLSENHLSHKNRSSGCFLCMPGSEVPHWMMHKSNNGSCLSITLDGHDLTGFSLCAVVACSDRCLRNIKCSVIFKDVFGCKKHRDFYFEDGDANKVSVECRSENLFIQKIDCSWVGISGVSEASLQFYIVDDRYEEDGAPIIKCGCHPLFNVFYGQEEEEEEEETEEEEDLYRRAEIFAHFLQLNGDEEEKRIPFRYLKDLVGKLVVEIKETLCLMRNDILLCGVLSLLYCALIASLDNH